MIIPLALGPRCLLVKVLMVVADAGSVVVLMLVSAGVGLYIGVVVGVNGTVTVGSNVSIFLCPLLLSTHNAPYRQLRGRPCDAQGGSSDAGSRSRSVRTWLAEALTSAA